jgi:hypothetical protein
VIAMRHLSGVAVLAWLGLTPHAALACSVCYSANDGNRLAFLLTTIFLSFLPLGIIGGVVYWLWRHVAARAAGTP